MSLNWFSLDKIEVQDVLGTNSQVRKSIKGLKEEKNWNWKSIWLKNGELKGQGLKWIKQRV